MPEGSWDALLPREDPPPPDGRVEGEEGTRPEDGRVTSFFTVEGREALPEDGRVVGRELVFGRELVLGRDAGLDALGEDRDGLGLE